MKKFLICFIFLCPFVYASSIEEALASVPLKDRVEMRIFFRLMIQQDQLAHVLFFDTKPAIMSAFARKENRIFQDRLLAKGWKAWKKWESRFPHPNFIFCEDDAGFESWEVTHIFVINKQTLKMCLYQNDDIFRQILGETFSPDTFISHLEESKQLYSSISHHEVLLGIILGFGRESSIAYENFSESEESDRHAAADDVRCHFYPVCFRGDPKSEEVSALLQKYRKEGREFLHFSKHKDILRLSLEALTQPNE